MKFELKDGGFYEITESQINTWNAIYPNVDVKQSLKDIQCFFETNPQQRKTANGLLKYINGWLNHENNKQND